MAPITLQQYESAERRAAHEEGRKGFRAHAAVSSLVWLVLVAVNVTVADEFPWAIFPIVGMSIGLWLHWYFGVVRSDELLRRHQADVERRAIAG